MKLVVVNGSPRISGRTGIAARFIAKKYGATIIETGQIPLFTGEHEQDELSVVKQLRETIKKADGVILASPEYHNAMSGALKNALDFLGSEQFHHKPVALLAVAGGGKGGMNALANMRTVGRGVYANVIPRQLVLDPPSFDRENDTLQYDSEQQVDALLSELQFYMKLHQKIAEESH
ncbi:NADPH-dependent FMN reductase [Bacillus salitolerans]|uniref:NADPH-dependent FMN reductase n=1 Tax=Bacillus salitolerans TaxID=1437434 RepID=A0ABW4LV98_9BACI